MRWIDMLTVRLRSIMRRVGIEEELDAELLFHLTQQIEENQKAGMNAADARAAARRALGNVAYLKDECRDSLGLRLIDEVGQDIRHAGRTLLKHRSFSVTAILTLAIGIGATTAIYSVVDRVLLQPLPFPDADRLVGIFENQRRGGFPTSYQEYLEWRSRTQTLSGLAAITFNPQVLMPTPAGTVRLSGALTSANYFETLGAKALLGRTLLSEDELHPDVVVLSFDTWQKYFNGDAGVVGSTVEFRSGTLMGRLFTIIGVLPEHMESERPIDFTTPIVVSTSGRPLGIADMIGRLRDGISVATASEEANAIGNAIRQPRPASAPPLRGPRFEARNLKDGVVAPLRPALRVLLATVGITLLIVCANVANLMLARGTAQRRDIALRLAIGSTRGRIIRQMLTESLALALAGGVGGAMLGAGGVALVKTLATTRADGIFRNMFGTTILPRANEVSVDLGLLGIAFAIAAITSVVFGLLPAFHLSRSNQVEAMSSRSGGTARRDTRFRGVLVIAQLAMATVLLVGAALLSSSFIRLAAVDKGYDAANVLAFQLVLPDEYSTTRKAESIESVLTRVRALPGVQAAGFAQAGILLGIERSLGSFVPAGQPPAVAAGAPDGSRLQSVSWGYLESMGVHVLSGRLFTSADADAAIPAIVVNQSVARRYFDGANAVGAYMDWYRPTGDPIQVQIVGVIADVRQGSLERAAYPEVYIDYRQLVALQQRAGVSNRAVDDLAFGFLSFGMRTQGNPSDAIANVTAVVKSVDPNAGLDAILPMERLVAASLAKQRFYAVMLGVFAGVATLLAAIGIYGVLAYAVVQRTQEIGIRMALGARRGQVVALLLRQGVLLAAIGISVGLIGAAAATRYLEGMLFGVTPLDRSTYAGVALAFTAVVVLASYLPARVATKVDPMVALRCE